MKTPCACRFVAVLALAVAGCGEEGETCGPSHGVVERVVDGDTVVLVGGLKVRYLNVDTPESTKVNDTECFGPEAAEFNRQQVEGKAVELTYDTECTDRFGRLLAHVWVDGMDVGLEEVKGGYGCALIIAPNTGSKKEFEDAERVAQSLPLGLWKECGNDGEPMPCGN